MPKNLTLDKKLRHGDVKIPGGMLYLEDWEVLFFMSEDENARPITLTDDMGHTWAVTLKNGRNTSVMNSGWVDVVATMELVAGDFVVFCKVKNLQDTYRIVHKKEGLDGKKKGGIKPICDLRPKQSIKWYLKELEGLSVDKALKMLEGRLGHLLQVV